MKHLSVIESLRAHLAAWHVAWSGRKRNQSQARSQNELEFLPAALEIIESPPSPLGYWGVRIIVLFFISAVTWAIYGKVDIVAVAHGKVIPSGHIKSIQPLELSKVAEIHVQEGQRVNVGDILVELDPTTQLADRQRVQSERSAIDAELWRVDALLVALASKSLINHSSLPVEPASKFMDTQRQQYLQQLAEHDSRLKAQEDEITQNKARLGATEETVKKLEAIIPLISERTRAMKSLHEKGLGAKLDYLELEQERIEQRQNLASLRKQMVEFRASIAQSQSRLELIGAEFKKSLHRERSQLEARLAILDEEFVKAQTLAASQIITAPVSGTVQQLAIHTIGGVVTPAQVLMKIVPIQSSLEVEAYIENKDIGFIDSGQVAEVKIDAFPFTKYGTIDGTILHLSQDAIENEQMGWVFAAQVGLERSIMNIDGKSINLMPGMSVSVEIKTGERRLIEYVLSPLLQYADESARER